MLLRLVYIILHSFVNTSTVGFSLAKSGGSKECSRMFKYINTLWKCEFWNFYDISNPPCEKELHYWAIGDDCKLYLKFLENVVMTYLLHLIWWFHNIKQLLSCPDSRCHVSLYKSCSKLFECTLKNGLISCVCDQGRY